MARSVDGGTNWSSVQRLELPTSTALILTPCLATNKQGVWLAAWEVEGPGPRIRIARSANNGQTWSSPADLNLEANQDASPISYVGQPSIATDGEGRWVILLTSNFDPSTNSPGNDRILSVHSSDDGLTWSGGAAVIAGGGFPKQNSHIVWDNNRFIAAWSTPHELEMVASYNGGASWTAVEAPEAQNDAPGAVVRHPRLIPSLPSGRVAVWLQSSPGATGPDLLTSREPRPSSAQRWFLY